MDDRPRLNASMRRARGRPRVERESADTGTPELILKRLRGETAETLDLCLERGILTPTQHWCGIHLRWLYTLRYGTPCAHAVDPTHLGGREITPDDPKWRAAREQEYQHAVALLQRRGYHRVVLQCCIHHERPPFLRRPATASLRSAQLRERHLDGLRQGLDLLAKEWCAKK